MVGCSCLDSGEGGHGGNAAVVVLVARHPDVPSLSPCSS